MIPRFARVVDMEPGMRFVTPANARQVLTWVGVERVVSRFPGKRRVRVLTKQGVSWVAEWNAQYLILEEW